MIEKIEPTQLALLAEAVALWTGWGKYYKSMPKKPKALMHLVIFLMTGRFLKSFAEVFGLLIKVVTKPMNNFENVFS